MPKVRSGIHFKLLQSLPIAVFQGDFLMLFKKTITNLAVDSAKDYLQERLSELRQLDLDHDGKKDVDQCADAVVNIAARVTDALESTDFQKLGSGMEQIISGMSLIGSSVDRQKLGLACDELAVGLTQLGKLLRLGFEELKEQK